MSNKEIERKKTVFLAYMSLCRKIPLFLELQKRKRKAQDQGDIAEEAKLCNAIGELYSQNGVYEREEKCTKSNEPLLI